MLNLTLQDFVESFDDCAFRHIHLLNQYDAYYSFSHPHQSAQCQRSRPRRPHGRPSRSASTKHCSRNWFLGVTKKGELRTFQIPTRAGTKLKRSILFIQRWAEDSPQSGTRQSIDQGPGTPRSSRSRANPEDDSENLGASIQPAMSTPSADSQSVQTTLKGRHAEQFTRKNCGILLRRCSKKGKRHLRHHKASDTND